MQKSLSRYGRDHSQLSKLLDEGHLLSEKKHQRLTMVEEKLGARGSRTFSKDNTYDQTGAIACMSQWPYADLFAQCGHALGYKGRFQNCNQWHLCPRCAVKRWGEASRKYADLFPNRQWVSITCSWQETLPGDWVSLNDVRLLWEAGFFAINQLYKRGKINGAVSRAEIAAYFLPYAVRPHVHSLAEASDEIDAMEIAELLKIHLRKHDDFLRPTPSVKVSEVTKGECPNVLWYLYLPHDLAEDYQWGRIKAEEIGREVDLNFEVDSLLDDLSLFRHGFHCVRPIGSMRGNKLLQRCM